MQRVEDAKEGVRAARREQVASVLLEEDIESRSSILEALDNLELAANEVITRLDSRRWLEVVRLQTSDIGTGGSLTRNPLAVHGQPVAEPVGPAVAVEVRKKLGSSAGA